jgi:hypothetical protein
MPKIKNILVIVDDKEEQIHFEFIQSKYVDNLHLIGKRYDRVIVSEKVSLSKDQWVEVDCCYYPPDHDDPNFERSDWMMFV